MNDILVAVIIIIAPIESVATVEAMPAGNSGTATRFDCTDSFVSFFILSIRKGTAPAI